LFDGVNSFPRFEYDDLDVQYVVSL
jgi:hypothetical protein